MAKRKRQRRKPGSGRSYQAANTTWTACYPRIGGGEHVRRGFRTRQEAESWLDSLVALHDQKHDVGQALRTVETAIDAWVNREKDERAWKPKMLADVRFKLGYVKPYLGSMALSDVLPDHVDVMLSDLGQSLAQTTIRHIRNYCYQVFQDAVLRRHIAYNPVIKPSRRKRLMTKEPERLSVQQAAILLHHADGSFYALAWWLLICCGLRSGEVCGLRRSDVDLVSCVLHIRQAVGDVGSAAVISLPKNDKQRDVPFPKALAPLFTAHEEVLIKRAARGLKDQTWHEYGLVFPGRSGEPLRPTSLRHMLKRLTDAAKLPAITTHMLRHTAAGLLEGAGCDRVTIGALLGHTPQSITGHYAPVSLTTLRPWIDQVYQMLHGDMTKIAAQSRAS